MAQPSTLYRFHLDLSDIDRGVYKAFDLRLAMHPSESPAFLVTRLIAYVLNDREFLEFSPGGLSDPEAPCIHATAPTGEIRLWIEVGNASARKLHRASKAAREVKVYTYKDPDLLLKEIRENKVYQAERIGVYSLDPRFLEKAAGRLERTNKWGLVHQEGSLTLSIGVVAENTELRNHPV